MIGAEPERRLTVEHPRSHHFLGLGETKQKPRGASIRRILEQSRRII